MLDGNKNRFFFGILVLTLGHSLALAPNALAQSAFAQTSESEPYGGPHVAPGSMGLAAGASPAAGTASVCASNAPCVLTGQYDVFRNNQNQNETTLGGMKNFTNFAPVNFFQLDTTDVAPGNTINPIIAQPLYLTGVPVAGTTHNMLIVATLNATVYAFDADTGATLWKRVGSSSLALDCSPTTGQAFTDIQTNGEPGIPNLAYYGIVATPVVDVAPVDPVLYTTVACTTSPLLTSYSWYLNAIDITTGADLFPGGVPITGTGFVASNELQRPSLLLTHPVLTNGQQGTYVYATFGTGVWEEAGGAYSYTGALFSWSIGYNNPLSSSTIAQVSTSSCPAGSTCPFLTGASLQTSNIFPPDSPLPCNQTDCDRGDNWIGNGGGIWSTGKGPAADLNGYVYAATGNGPFDCTYTGTTTPQNCTNPALVLNWGESVFEMAPPNGTTMSNPVDFFTPYKLKYPSAFDPTPAPYQFEEMNRFDLDFGYAGVVIFRTELTSGQYLTWAMTTNKIGDLYLLPKNGAGLGRFRANDNGLTSGQYSTQNAFQLSRFPATGETKQVCPVANGPTHNTYSYCDGVSELAFWNNILIAWPINETLRAFQGALTSPSSGSYNYKFNTTPVVDPCPGATSCANFPAAGYPGGNMAIAADGKTAATLWSVVIPSTAPYGTHPGTLYAYTIAPTPAVTITPAWNSTLPTSSNCVAPPAPLPLTSWQVQPMSELTIANGHVYIPTQSAVSSTGATIAGVLVYGLCATQ